MMSSAPLYNQYANDVLMPVMDQDLFDLVDEPVEIPQRRVVGSVTPEPAGVRRGDQSANPTLVALGFRPPIDGGSGRLELGGADLHGRNGRPRVPARR